jgi:tRNA(Ile)-lysidine synthase
MDGLRGIAARRPIEPDLEVVRPLLGVTRDEVLAYLNEIGQPARYDHSNDDPRFTRNRIRHDLLPLLMRDYNPRIVEVLNRLAAQAEEVFCVEEQSARTLLEQTELPSAGAMIVLDTERLRQEPARLIRLVLRLIWQRESWPMGEMGFEQWQRVAALVQVSTGAHDLPGGVRARRQGRVLQLAMWKDQSPADPGE